MLNFLSFHDVQIKTTLRNHDTFAAEAQTRRAEVPNVGENGKQLGFCPRHNEGVTCTLTLKSCLASSPEAELWLPCPSNSTPGCALRDAATSRQRAQIGNRPNVCQQERGLTRGGVPKQQNLYNDGSENCHMHTRG